jgi:predicted nucleic acid-binding protein
MSVLIDTSVWIEFFRKVGDPVTKQRVSDLLQTGQAAYTCPIRYEVICGARPHELPLIQAALDASQRFVLSPRVWDIATNASVRMREAGLTFPTSDVLIACIALDQKVPLYSRDAHFLAMRDALLTALRLA